MPGRHCVSRQGSLEFNGINRHKSDQAAATRRIVAIHDGRYAPVDRDRHGIQFFFLGLNRVYARLLLAVRFSPLRTMAPTAIDATYPA